MTVLELVVTLAAIVVVVAAGPRLYEVFRIKAHDIRRLRHVEQLQNALQLYYTHNNTYPVATREEEITGDDTLTRALSRSFLILDTRLPVDPRAPEYTYRYQTSSDGQQYTITYCMEAFKDATHAPGCDNRAYPIPIGSK